jgi:hypothetical protein
MVARSQDLERSTFSEGRYEVLNLAVNFDCKGVPKEPLTDGTDHIARQSALFDLAGGAVGEGKGQHF